MQVPRFSMRFMLATVFVIAVVAAALLRWPDTSTALWAIGAVCGILWTRGRGRRCLILTSVGSIIGIATWVAYALWSPLITFDSEHSALIMIVGGGGLGLLFGVGVRAIMEGFRLRTIQQHADAKN